MTRSLTLADLAARLGAEVVGEWNRPIEGIRPLDLAGPEHLSFLHNPKYLDQAASSRAGALIVGSPDGLEGRNLLVCDEPYLAVAQVLEIFHPPASPAPGVHASAVVAGDLVLGEGAAVGPQVAVADGVRIGAGSVIGAGCVIGSGCTIGNDTLLHPRVVIEDGCVVGDRCVLQAGAVVGSDGYGFATVDGVHHKVPQVGVVVIEDDVEIGANTTIDRATMGETRIGRGSKIDNLVQVAHNVQIGAGCLLVAQVGVSGSTKIGAYSVLGGQVGVAGHLELGDQTMVAAKSAVMKSTPAGAVVAGRPARPQRDHMRSQAALQRLDGMRKKLAELEKRVAAAEEE